MNTTYSIIWNKKSYKKVDETSLLKLMQEAYDDCIKIKYGKISIRNNYTHTKVASFNWEDGWIFNLKSKFGQKYNSLFR